MSQRALQHLAKYLTRAACNAGGGPLSDALAGLLEKDLYEWIEGGRPADVFRRHARALPEPDAHAVELAFIALDRLEPRVRAREPAALQTACELALRIAASIHASLEVRP